MADPEPRSDEELIAAANAGDAEAFAALYRRHRDWVLRLAGRFCDDHADVCDVLQDTFVYLLKKFPGFRLTARLTTFLYPVVRNLSLARRRKKGRHVDTEAELDRIPAAPGTTDTSDLTSVLNTLSGAQREVLLMRIVDDMSLAEIATALEVPVGTVKSRLHTALAALRDDPRTRRYFER